MAVEQVVRVGRVGDSAGGLAWSGEERGAGVDRDTAARGGGGSISGHAAEAERFAAQLDVPDLRVWRVRSLEPLACADGGATASLMKT